MNHWKDSKCWICNEVWRIRVRKWMDFSTLFCFVTSANTVSMESIIFCNHVHKNDINTADYISVYSYSCKNFVSNSSIWTPNPQQVLSLRTRLIFGFYSADILTALCLLDLLECFTTRYTVDSHFQGHKKTELVMIHPLSHSKQTGRWFHCLSHSDAMSYSLQAYCSLWSVSLSFLFFFQTLEGNVHLIWTGIGIPFSFSGADYLMYWYVVVWHTFNALKW